MPSLPFATRSIGVTTSAAHLSVHAPLRARSSGSSAREIDRGIVSPRGRVDRRSEPTTTTTTSTATVPAATVVRAALRASRTTRRPSRHRPGCARPIDACTFLSFKYIPLDPTRLVKGWQKRAMGVATTVAVATATTTTESCFTCCFGVNTDTPQHNLTTAGTFIRGKLIAQATRRDETKPLRNGRPN